MTPRQVLEYGNETHELQAVAKRQYRYILGRLKEEVELNQENLQAQGFTEVPANWFLYFVRGEEISGCAEMTTALHEMLKKKGWNPVFFIDKHLNLNVALFIA